MPLRKILTYREESEGVMVRIWREGDNGVCAGLLTIGHSDYGGPLEATFFTSTLEEAQLIARQIVGMQRLPSGSVIKRGPRPPIQLPQGEEDARPD